MANPLMPTESIRTAMAEERAEQQKRDWVAVLAPTLLAVVISLAIQGIGLAWYFGSLNTRVMNVEKRQESMESEMRETFKDRDTAEGLNKQELDLRLNRMDDKLDRIIEAQHPHAQ